jgi:hypothetical protein
MKFPKYNINNNNNDNNNFNIQETERMIWVKSQSYKIFCTRGIFTIYSLVFLRIFNEIIN